MRAAVIGIGSNSVRMLVAEAADGEIRRISRDRAGTRLFAGLDEAGNLSREAMASSCAAVKRMADSARSQGAERVHLFQDVTMQWTEITTGIVCRRLMIHSLRVKA